MPESRLTVPGRVREVIVETGQNPVHAEDRQTAPGKARSPSSWKQKERRGGFGKGQLSRGGKERTTGPKSLMIMVVIMKQKTWVPSKGEGRKVAERGRSICTR